MISEFFDVSDLVTEPVRELTHVADPDQLDYIDPDTGMIRARTPAKLELTDDQHDLMLHRRMMTQKWWDYYAPGDKWRQLKEDGHIIFTSNGGE